MSRTCDICGKGLQFGNNVSHAKNKSQKIWYPNIQSVKTIQDGTVKRINACTRCIRSGEVVKKVHG